MAVFSLLCKLLKADVIPFIPNVDGELLTKAPATLLEEGAFTPVDVLLGTNRDDGVIIFTRAFCTFDKDCKKYHNLSRELFDEKINTYLYLEHDDNILDIIKDAAVIQFTVQSVGEETGGLDV